MTYRASLLALALAACSSPPPRTAPPPDGLPSVARAALASRGAHALASSLANEVGPRLAGSPGDVAATKWAEKTMRSLGLVNVHLEPVVVPVWRRGEDRARIVSGDALAVNALGWSGSTPPEGVEADVVRFATLDALDKADADAVRGKIVFVDARMDRSPDGSGYGRAVEARYRAQTLGAAKGAVVALIRSVGTDEAYPHTGSTNRGKAPGIPIGALSNASADKLAQKLAAGSARVHVVMTSERLPDATSANVVGEIAGSQKPEEVVLLGAHLDSWDTGRGALDDGAGCGIVLEAMRLLAKERPQRTVRVVLFAAEENSLAGGAQYAKAHESELEKIVLTIEADSGTHRAVSIGFAGDAAHADTLRGLAAPLASLAPFTDRRGHSGADVGPLLARGVPSVDVSQDVSRYFDLHHTPGDTADKLDAEALAQVTAIVAQIALGAADAKATFGRVPPKQRHDED